MAQDLAKDHPYWQEDDNKLKADPLIVKDAKSRTVRADTAIDAPKAKNKSKHRITATLDHATYVRMQQWADAKGISINDFLREAVELKIRFENRNYPLPALEIIRLSELVEEVKALSTNMRALEITVHTGVGALMDAATGMNCIEEIK